MSNDEPLDDQVATRINGKVKTKFLRKCKKLKKGHNLVLREFVTAFNDGRLKIIPTKEEQELR